VTVVDAGLPGHGTSGTSFGWVNASQKGSGAYLELSMSAVAAYGRLTSSFVPTGCLTWTEDPGAQAALSERVEQLRAQGYPSELLSPARARALEPALRLGPAVEHVALYPGEGFVESPSTITGLVAAARRHGAEFRFKDRVTDIEIGNGRVRRVGLDSGAWLDTDVVVACCGRWSGEIGAFVGARVPLVSPEPKGSAALGLLVRASPVAARIRRVIYTDSVMIRPADEEGRVLLHSYDHDRRVSIATREDPPPPEANDVLAEGRAVMPALHDSTVESARIGIRALPSDGLPIVGWLSGLEGLYLVATHSGVTLAPYLAELVVSEVLDGGDEAQLAPFRPQRFDLL
jgi:glycine/D-amino acid oxidase-like deaminating enzyme